MFYKARLPAILVVRADKIPTFLNKAACIQYLYHSSRYRWAVIHYAFIKKTTSVCFSTLSSRALSDNMLFILRDSTGVKQLKYLCI